MVVLGEEDMACGGGGGGGGGGVKVPPHNMFTDVYVQLVFLFLERDTTV